MVRRLPELNLVVRARNLTQQGFNAVASTAQTLSVRVNDFGKRITAGFQRIRVSALEALGAVGAFYVALQSRAEQIAQETRLQRALNNLDSERVTLFRELAKEIEGYGVVADQVTIAALAQTSAFVGQEEQLEKLAPLLADVIADQKGINSTIGDGVAVGKSFVNVLSGEINAFRELGVNINDINAEWFRSLDATERTEVAIGLLSESMGGFNKDLAVTSGSIDDIGTALSNVTENIGKTLVDSGIVAAINFIIEGLRSIVLGIRTVYNQLTGDVGDFDLNAWIEEGTERVRKFNEELKSQLQTQEGIKEEATETQQVQEKAVSTIRKEIEARQRAFELAKSENMVQKNSFDTLTQQVAYLRRIYGSGLSEREETAARVRARNPSLIGNLAADDPAREFVQEQAPRFQEHEIARTLRDILGELRRGGGGRGGAGSRGFVTAPSVEIER